MSIVRRIGWTSSLLLMLLFVPEARAGGLMCAYPELAHAADDAVGSGSRARTAIATLRARGPLGLEVFVQRYGDVLARGPSHPRWREVTAAMDQVAAQRAAWSSRLFWYTDLAAAQAAARRLDRPILSLRLLGRLDQDLSCANSRYFRTALYANRELSALLRDRFVLHWASERPAPRITIDYGDGRRVERTITGNSIHYVLDAAGRVIDALPGLYGPQAFRRAIDEALVAAQSAAALPPAERAGFLRDYHARAAAAWPEPAVEPAVSSGAPDAVAAGRLAMTKAMPERPMLNAVLAREATAPAAVDPGVLALAAANGFTARLDAGSLALMRHQLAGTAAGRDPAAFVRMVEGFERTMTLDGFRNESTLRRTIHAWLAAGPLDLERLNARVYAELFLTPRADPWLGLVPADAYAALEGEGLR